MVHNNYLQKLLKDVTGAKGLIGEAYENSYDVAIMISGDEDFVSSIRRVKKLGKKIENAYFSSSSSYNLRKACDYSIHLNKIINKIIN